MMVCRCGLSCQRIRESPRMSIYGRGDDYYINMDEGMRWAKMWGKNQMSEIQQCAIATTIMIQIKSQARIRI